MGMLQICGTVLILPSIITGTFAVENNFPTFGRDTVLVWNSENQGFSADLVVRIAEFMPDRFVEWEDSNTQGTIFMASRDVLSAKGFVNTNLFGSGMDTKGKNATTLWLSQRIFLDLKEKKKAKCDLDGVSGLLTYLGEGELEVEVNRAPMMLPIIMVKDDRGGERWFLDQAANPLMVKHIVRSYTQVLASITTDRRNTLRWIKGRKLNNISQ